MDENNERKRIADKSIYFKAGLTVCIVGIVLILAYYIINNGNAIGLASSKLNKILRPFYIGFVLTFLLCPIYNNVVKLFYKLFSKKVKPSRALTYSKVIATIISLIVIFVVVFALIMLVIPDFIESILSVVPKIEPAIDDLIKWGEKQFRDYPEIVEFLSERLNDLSDKLFAWAKDTLIPQAQNILASLTNGIMGTIGALVDIVIALFICVYFLNGKEKFIAQTKKIILALLHKSTANKVFEFGRLTNETFAGFINGKILDSFIIGLICFVSMLILNIPLAQLVSIIVGVTNIIPFFGPIIGAVPSALLLIMINPMACLKFIILVLVLQQLDGNFIGPKILGKSTKLQSFWVMFAIIVGGGLFGFLGMLVGVPCFAIIYAYIAKFINNKLKKKGLITETLSYETFEQYGCDSEVIKKSRRDIEREKRKEEERKVAERLIAIFSKKNNDK